ncbi:hypothetical protein RhiirA1_102422 [Rhizophagus irregularis]|uniref:Uncharacterized protein n=1 Tax=Rhizophagus irregularis TaxID=588596 RepID=A0A2N0QYZ3_9GLOM|nr:hypothetical protein RhiirA1_102422 [Rhizophagus irregularis]
MFDIRHVMRIRQSHNFTALMMLILPPSRGIIFMIKILFDILRQTSRISHSNLVRRVSAIPIFSTNIKRIKKANQ